MLDPLIVALNTDIGLAVYTTGVAAFCLIYGIRFE